MANHIWTVLCETSSVDSETNNISLFKCLEQVEFSIVVEGQNDQEAPSSLPIRMELVSLWQRSEHEADNSESLIRIQLKTPGGRRLKPFEATTKFGSHMRWRYRLRITSIPHDGQGAYWFHVQQKNTNTGRWKTVSRVPLEVRVKIRTEKQSVH